MDHSVTVLLVESDEASREILGRFAFERLKGCTIHSADGVEEALSILKAVHVDIMVCDAFLVKEKKVSFIREVCSTKKSPDIVIVITGHSDLRSGDFHEEGCVKKLMYRPVNLAELGSALKEAVAELQGRAK